jgi:hypothetical protein
MREPHIFGAQVRVLVCGSRSWADFEAIVAAMKPLPKWDTTIIEGCAPRGADQMAERAALLFGHEVEHYPALWNVYGKRAGMVRNERMLREGRPDEVWAFWDGSSRGTANMIELAKAAGVPVKVTRSAKAYSAKEGERG